MDPHRFIRRLLWIAAVFNLGGALMFAFPAGPIGQLAGLPADVPLIYRALLTLFVLLFGGTYAWLAAQAQINRPLLALGAIGKFSAFLCVLALWLAGESRLVSVAVISGDLVFAGLFARWLWSSRAAT